MDHNDAEEQSSPTAAMINAGENLDVNQALLTMSEQERGPPDYFGCTVMSCQLSFPYTLKSRSGCQLTPYGSWGQVQHLNSRTQLKVIRQDMLLQDIRCREQSLYATKLIMTIQTLPKG